MRNLLLFLSFFLSTACTAQGFLKTDGPRIVDGQGREVILRSMGLGGWMLQEPYMLQLSGIAGTQQEIRQRISALIGEQRTDTFYAAWLRNHCRRADIDSMAAWGFNSVRLPMHYNLFTLPVEAEPVAGRHTWLEKGFALTDSLLQWCAANRMYLILDLHAAPGGQGADRAISDRDTTKPSLWQSAANQEKTVALWKKLAERYANEPWIGGYDLINETNWGFENEKDLNGCAETGNVPLRRLLVEITAAIRTVDPRHMIFLEANCWANNYKGIFPLWDNNLVVSFHKYWNNNDLASIQSFIDIRAQHQVPVWMGESGENSNVWFRAAISLLEEAGIGWAWWPLKKLGFNNPLQIKTNSGYQQLLAYWKGQGPQPDADAAYRALLQLAEAARIENNIYHKDVIDAMFRQRTSTATLPWRRQVIGSQALVFAADYDLGRNGFAYYDLDTANYRVSTGRNTPGNRGQQYRNDGVDIAACTDSISNGYCVGWTEKGEWLQYTVTVEKAGRYHLAFRTAARDSAGALDLEVNGVRTARDLVVPVTGSEGAWRSTGVRSVALRKGENRLRIHVRQGGFLLNYLQFRSASKNERP